MLACWLEAEGQGGKTGRLTFTISTPSFYQVIIDIQINSKNKAQPIEGKDLLVKVLQLEDTFWASST